MGALHIGHRLVPKLPHRRQLKLAAVTPEVSFQSHSGVDVDRTQHSNEPTKASQVRHTVELLQNPLDQTSPKPHQKIASDFSLHGHKHLEACFGEAMQVIQDDRIIDPVPEGMEEINRVGQLSKVIMKWASGWGGVAYWPISLDDSFTRALEEGRQDRWQEELLSHASTG